MSTKFNFTERLTKIIGYIGLTVLGAAIIAVSLIISEGRPPEGFAAIIFLVGTMMVVPTLMLPYIIIIDAVERRITAKTLRSLSTDGAGI
jgi:hypothetical protein